MKRTRPSCGLQTAVGYSGTDCRRGGTGGSLGADWCGCVQSAERRGRIDVCRGVQVEVEQRIEHLQVRVSCWLQRCTSMSRVACGIPYGLSCMPSVLCVAFVSCSVMLYEHVACHVSCCQLPWQCCMPACHTARLVPRLHVCMLLHAPCHAAQPMSCCKLHAACDAARRKRTGKSSA